MMGPSLDLRIILAGLIAVGLFAGINLIFPEFGIFANANLNGGAMLIGMGILTIFLYCIFIWLCNYFIEYRDECNLRCRVFGHSDKNLGKRTKILYPDDQPNDLWEYELHKCRRCGKENEGWYHHNITSQKRYERENWKINLF